MFDIIIIGGGPGGYAAAIRASQLGGKVALIESGQIGGTCVNRGCIPSKIWMRSAHLLKQIKGAEAFGIRAEVQNVDFAAIIERKNGVANDIRMGMESLLGKNRVNVISGRAVLRNRRSVEVDGAVHETRKVIIAAGSRMDVPDIKGLEDCAVTTNEVFDMKTVPSSVLIWGADAIEVEMATLLNLMGAKVTIAMESQRILPREDGDTGQRLGQALRSDGVEILARHTLESVRKSKSGFICQLSAKEDREVEVEVEQVLVGARRPNTAHLGLESIGVRIKEDGGIQVNDRLETTIGGIYAVGDAAGGWMLSHAASAMGIVAAENAMGKTSKFPFELIPRGIWTIPQVGAVGLSEEEAEDQGYEVEVGDFPYPINGLAMAQDQMTGAAKIVSDSRYGKILGVHVVGAQAVELVGQAVLAMQLESTVGEFAKSIAVHPTFSETLVEASRDTARWALYLPPSS